MDNYIVELYNKDDGIYKTILRTSDKNIAFELCNVLGNMCKEDCIISNRYTDNVSNGIEYFDWCQVLDPNSNCIKKLGVLTDFEQSL